MTDLSASDTLEALRQDREDLFASAQAIADAFNTQLTVDNANSFRPRYERLSKLQDEFTETHRAIVRANLRVLVPAQKLATDGPKRSFEDMVAAAQTVYLKTAEPSLKVASTPSAGASGAGPKPGYKHHPYLGKLKVPTFSGKSEEWLPFYNVYRSSVHGNEELDLTDKFTYLLSRIKGEPLSLIGTIDFDPENYQKAWDLLVDRYNSRRRLATIHFNGLLDLPTLQHDSSLSSFLAKLQEHTHALASLKFDVNHYGPLLVSQILRRFSPYHRKRFEDRRQNPLEYPTYDEMLKFLKGECARMDDADMFSQPAHSSAHAKASKSLHASVSSPSQTGSATTSDQRSLHVNSSAPSRRRSNRDWRPCKWCKGQHSLSRCPELLRMSVSERKEQVRRRRLCFNCLSSDHLLPQCDSGSRCLHCKKEHFTLLHDPTDVARTPPAHALLGTAEGSRGHVCLPTARLQLVTSKGTQWVRGLLDTGSQSTFLRSQCAAKFGLRVENSLSEVRGMSQLPVTVQGLASVSLAAHGKTFARSHRVVVIKEITGATPSTPISQEVRHRLRDLPLADPEFDRPGPIDILIGADLYPRVVLGKTISLGDGLPNAIQTIAGYVIIGSAPTRELYEQGLTSNQREPDTPAPLSTLLCTQRDDLTASIQKFWQLQEPAPPITVPAEEDPAELHYRETTITLESGRLQVRLPFSEPPSRLGESRGQALMRLKSLEKKFHRDPEYHKRYNEIMQAYENDGIMQLAEPDITNGLHYFIPHHGVTRAESTTSALRIVLDASAPTTSGVSLNQILHVGPKLLSDIRDVLFHFRRHTFVLGCDVKAMYHQFALHSDDQAFHLLLWRYSSCEPVRVYKMTRLTFGVSSSAFIAIRSVMELATQHGLEFPRAARAITEGGLYVDNIYFGADNLEDAKLLQQELTGLFAKGQLVLRKWLSNAPELLTHLDPAELESPKLWHDDATTSFPILGLQWINQQDMFSYMVHNLRSTDTKRGIASLISSIFDPLGLIGPVVFLAKTILQRLWLQKIDWDQALPEEIVTIWQKFLGDLPALEQVRVPRELKIVGPDVEIHGFCDASDDGYAAVIYSRCEVSPGTFQTTLVTSRSRLAPLKTVSTPRLELCGAHLLSELLPYIVPLFRQHYNVAAIYAWTDSTIVLYWIRTCPHRLKTFVANRVAAIQEALPETKWGHVSTRENPADVASRGQSATRLLSLQLWWEGPPWLKIPASQWPPQIIPPPPEILPESKPSHQVLTTSVAEPVHENGLETLFSRFSDWATMQRVIAVILRFTHNTRHPENRQSGPITVGEFWNAERVIIKKIQADAFAGDLLRLRKGTHCSPALSRLSPFLDTHGLIRVGGRLQNSPASSQQKHPWLLPGKHPLVVRLIQYYHTRPYLHPGAQLLQSLLARRYWILAGRDTIRSVVFSCRPCFKTRPKNNPPLMGNLPSPRVTPARPFAHSGMDLAGPFQAKVHSIRFAKTVPVYLCIFVCMVTKAVHIELVQDLTADAFTAALTRFAGRRGNPSDLYSDQGTNFTGTSRELARLFKSLQKGLADNSAFQHILQERRIKFHLNPPAAPQQGGLWEAAVKSAKQHLHRVLQGQTINLDEFNTLVIRVEAMLNSRPLYAASPDPTDLAPLTPGHFLIGAPLALPIEQEHSELPSLPAKRWHRVQAFAQSIWRRWQNEYLQTLQPRGKWQKRVENLKLGSLVLIHDPSLPPMAWRTGRVVKVHPGADGIVRVATVRTANGELQRPVTKLFPLPGAESETSSH